VGRARTVVMCDGVGVERLHYLLDGLALCGADEVATATTDLEAVSCSECVAVLVHVGAYAMPRTGPRRSAPGPLVVATHGPKHAH
jgi:hypothetical protein